LNNCSKAYPVNTRVELALKLEPQLREKAKLVEGGWIVGII